MKTIPHKPSDCACDYPEHVYGTGTRHAAACPVQRAWFAQHGGRATDDPRRAHKADNRERGPVPTREQNPR